jgi:hypothetical protein
MSQSVNDSKQTDDFVVLPVHGSSIRDDPEVDGNQSVASGASAGYSALRRAARILQSVAVTLPREVPAVLSAANTKLGLGVPALGQASKQVASLEQPLAPQLAVSAPPTDSKVPSVSGSSALSSAVIHRTLQRRSRASSRGNKQWNYRPFQADLVQRYVQSGAPSTSFFPVFNLAPNNQSLVTEAGNFAVLFDEQRCTAVTVHVRATSSVVPSNLNLLGAASWALVYDPSDVSAYTSVAGTLISGQHIGPVGFNNGPSTSSQNKVGYLSKTFKPPNPMMPTADTSAPNELVGKGWYSSKDQNAIVGYLKGAVDSVTGATTAMDCFVIYHMEYRERT